MALRNIVQDGDPILKKKCRPVTKFDDRLAELLAKKYPSATIVKTYETDKSLNAISGTAAESERIAKAVASVKPDLVIASQCD